MARAYDAVVSRWLALPGYEKLTNWVYYSEVPLTINAALTFPLVFFDTAGQGSATVASSNIQRANTFAPNPEKFILTSIAAKLKVTGSAGAAHATEATQAGFADLAEAIRASYKLQLFASQGQLVLDLPYDAIPAGPEVLGFDSAGAAYSTGGFGAQDGYPFYYPFERETTSTVQLVSNLPTGLTAFTVPNVADWAPRIQLRFNGVRMLKTGAGISTGAVAR